MNRNTVAGVAPGDPAAEALARALDECSRGTNSVSGKSGVVGASWFPEKGGWVVHSTAWALHWQMPKSVLHRAATILAGSDPVKYRHLRAVMKAAVASYFFDKQTR
jgi:hypothetical protein